jgi:hypothetical protein
MASGRAETAMCTPAVEMTQACAAPPTHPAQTDGSYTLTVQGTRAARSVSSSQFALMINHLARADIANSSRPASTEDGVAQP